MCFCACGEDGRFGSELLIQLFKTNCLSHILTSAVIQNKLMFFVFCFFFCIYSEDGGEADEFCERHEQQRQLLCTALSRLVPAHLGARRRRRRPLRLLLLLLLLQVTTRVFRPRGRNGRRLWSHAVDKIVNSSYSMAQDA